MKQKRAAFTSCEQRGATYRAQERALHEYVQRRDGYRIRFIVTNALDNRKPPGLDELQKDCRRRAIECRRGLEFDRFARS